MCCTIGEENLQSFMHIDYGNSEKTGTIRKAESYVAISIYFDIDFV